MIRRASERHSTPPLLARFDLPAVRFLAAGAANTAVSAALFWALLRVYAGVPHAAALAQATAYAVGIALGFTVNRRWAFRSDGAIRRELPRFVVAHAGALAVSTAALDAAVGRLGMPVAPAWLLVVACTTVANFTVQRYWVFSAR